MPPTYHLAPADDFQDASNSNEANNFVYNTPISGGGTSGATSGTTSGATSGTTSGTTSGATSGTTSGTTSGATNSNVDFNTISSPTTTTSNLSGGLPISGGGVGSSETETETKTKPIIAKQSLLDKWKKLSNINKFFIIVAIAGASYGGYQHFKKK
jgi:hypothetical protein